MSDKDFNKENRGNPKGVMPVPIADRIKGGAAGGLVTSAKGVSLVRGKYIEENSVMAKTLKKCSECSIRDMCDYFEADSRCFYQIRALKASYKKDGSMTSGNPRDLLIDIQTTVDKLEEVIRYNEKHGNPTSAKELKELAFLKLQIYNMVYGGKPTQATQVNVNTSTMDVKSLMAELRKEKEEK